MLRLVEDDPDGELSFDYSLLIETPDIVAIPLGGKKHPGLFTFVDADDVALIGRGWYASKLGPGKGVLYAVRRAKPLHRLIMKPGSLDTDHRNGDGLDNTRANLRIVTTRQNLLNRRPTPGPSRFIGVSLDAINMKWRATIWVEGKQKHLGRFTSEVEAARARDVATLEHYGEYGRLNFPPQSNFIIGNERIAWRVTVTNYWPWTPLDTPSVGIPVRREL